MRREFLQINAQLKDMKQTDKELARIEVLQVNRFKNKTVIHTKVFLCKDQHPFSLYG